MFVSSVSDAMLSKTTIMAKNQRIKGASVFPFFCRSGQVKRLMLLLPGLSCVLMIPFAAGQVKVSLSGTVRLPLSLAELTAYSDFTSEHVEDLYHYDPGWRLSHARFASCWAKKRIQQSNCADSMEKQVRQILFSRDLSQLEEVVMRSSYLNPFRTPSPETLLKAMPPARSEKPDASAEEADGGWQLKPIWWGNGFQ